MRAAARSLVLAGGDNLAFQVQASPAYEVIDQIGDVEVRRYRPALLAEITLASPSPESVAIAIDSFARYLFGPGADGCDRDLGLAVPSPHQCGRGDWRVRFFIANDMAPEEAPLPSSDALRLVREPGRLIAALAHDPKASGRMVHANRRKLQETIRATRRYELEDASDWASYDAPFALPFCQRAETLTEVREASASEAGLIWELMTRRGSRAA